MKLSKTAIVLKSDGFEIPANADPISTATTKGIVKPIQNAIKSRQGVLSVSLLGHCRGLNRIIAEKIARNGAIVSFIPIDTNSKNPANSILCEELPFDVMIK